MSLVDRPLVALVNSLLSVKPLFHLAKQQARQMMIKRAAAISVDWIAEANHLRNSPLEDYRKQIDNPALVYPEYYVRSFHGYDEGNLGWTPAVEVEVAAYAVHAGIWPEAGAQGDAKLRQTYHDVLQSHLAHPPQRILDLGCSVGMSTFALQSVFPEAQITGVDLSPYFLAVALYRTEQNHTPNLTWVHAAAEATGLASGSFDLISACLLFHELPQPASRRIVQEAYRLLVPGGSLAIMDMNPASSVYAQMPPYILTLLKSTEPYLDDYFSLDLKQTLLDSGFQDPTILCHTPRHRVVLAQKA
jgi:ubiquinone/menaquinone biosynthesis C-methylase UbiE